MKDAVERIRKEKRSELLLGMSNASTSISDLKDIYTIDKTIGEIVIGDNCCNENSIKELDISWFPFLKAFKVGDKSCCCITGLQLTNLALLEKVEIGTSSFASQESCNRLNEQSKDGHFYLKKCARLRELKIGCWSFMDYSVCKIEDVPSLKVIEMGEWMGWSHNFKYASLELKSDSRSMK